MSTLSKETIKKHIAAGELITNPHIENQEVQVQAASYDLRAGKAIWKESGSEQLRIESLAGDGKEPETLTLKPGQMMIVVTLEEIKLTAKICGTVYSRNSLQKANILALNAGHVDPGFQGHIIIRLINLGSNIWTFRLGDPIFTMVFQHLDVEVTNHDFRVASETVASARRTAEQAFSNPFHDLYKSEIAKQLNEHDNKLETRLRDKFASEYFQKNHLQHFVIEVAVALFAALVLVLKVPWMEILKWLK